MTMKIPVFLVAFVFFSFVAGVVSPATAARYSPLLISVKEAIETKKNNPQAIFVDVRREGYFKKIHIPESINVPLHFIKTKGYLRNMYVILVDWGYSDSRLLHQAELLNKKGIETVVLAGGLAAWSQRGGNLSGSDFTDQSILHRVNPARFSEAEFSRYIDISPEKTAGYSHLLARAEHVPVTSQDDFSVLVAAIDEPGQPPFATVLLFNRYGEYSLLEDLPGKCRTTLFFLQEGSEGYSKMLLQQRAILAPKSKRMKTIGGCSTCPPEEEPR